MKSIILIAILFAGVYSQDCSNALAYNAGNAYYYGDLVTYQGCCYSAQAYINPGDFPFNTADTDYPWGPWTRVDFECNHDPDCTDNWNEHEKYPTGSSVCYPDSNNID